MPLFHNESHLYDLTTKAHLETRCNIDPKGQILHFHQGKSQKLLNYSKTWAKALATFIQKNPDLTDRHIHFNQEAKKRI